VHRRLVSLGAAIAVLAMAGSAAAVTVHVRVEGAKKTLFGAAEPLLTPYQGEIFATDGSAIELSAPTVLAALEAASRKGDFYYRVQATSFGPFIDQIGRNPSSETRFWVFTVNGEFAPVGAADFVLEDGDRVLWYLAPFDPTGVGPNTLDLSSAGRGCFRAFTVDANGERSRVGDVVFRVNDRKIGDADGHLCPRGDWHRIRVTKEGAIRSKVIVR
jgi:hypothetical protein